jgi:hypothetical protein
MRLPAVHDSDAGKTGCVQEEAGGVEDSNDDGGWRRRSVTTKKPEQNPDDWEMIRCQFCARTSRRGNWLAGDICPECGMPYDPILAQEGDD